VTDVEVTIENFLSRSS